MQLIRYMLFFNRVQLFATPMDCHTPGLPVLHHLQEFAQIHASIAYRYDSWLFWIKSIKFLMMIFHSLLYLEETPHYWISYCISWCQSYKRCKGRGEKNQSYLKNSKWFKLLCWKWTYDLRHTASKYGPLASCTITLRWRNLIVTGAGRTQWPGYFTWSHNTLMWEMPYLNLKERSILIFKDSGVPRGIWKNGHYCFPDSLPLAHALFVFCCFPWLHSSPNLIQKCSGLTFSSSLCFSMKAPMSHKTSIK